MSSQYEYSYGQTLLSINNVNLYKSADGSHLLEKPEEGSIPILKDVTAEIHKIIRPGQIQGQVVGFIGPSGIGKTQLFRIIAGLNKPTSGSVTLLGSNKPVLPGDVGVVAQNYPLFKHRTIMKNLLLSASKKEPDEKVCRDKIMSMLSLFKLTSTINQHPKQLSGGQQQRIAIIQQILCSEHFLLMDEPFSGLDIITEGHATQLILTVANMNDLNTVIVVTHDISAAVSIADHIWALGRQKDSLGNFLPGASITKTYDLIERGLCWDQWDEHAMIKPTIAEFIREVKEDFYNL